MRRSTVRSEPTGNPLKPYAESNRQICYVVVQKLHRCRRLLQCLRASRPTGDHAGGLALPVRSARIMKKPRNHGDPRACQDEGHLSPSLQTLKEHRQFKRSSWNHLRSTRLLVVLSSPLIYACVLPFLLLDGAVTLYQLVCFPIYGIPRVRRKDFLVFDRGRLAYLNTIEKVGCVYCSYANGLLALISEVAARTERYFCPIRHARPVLHEHSQYGKFLPYGDARAYRAESDAISRANDDPGSRRS